MRDFLSNFGLYQIYDLSKSEDFGDKNYSSPFEIKGHTFDYYCKDEKSVKTFEIEIEPAYDMQWGMVSSIETPDAWIKNGKLNYTVHTLGKCKSCGKTQVQFLLNVFQESLIEDEGTIFFIQKVGIEPQAIVLPNPIISKYFERETNNWYYKGINSLNEGYGIGAMAYFRRIIEKELINIIEDIKTLPDAHSSEIQNLLDEHSTNPRISTIYENIFDHLPYSLKAIGDNPIKLLYKQTSEALHSLSENDSKEKAEKILQLLNFVILKINEERSEIKLIKETIKSLK